MRIDLYRLVHKAQRHHLMGFARDLGLADLRDEAARLRIAGGVRAVVEMLEDHAENERRYIHPLFARLGSKAATLDEEHRELAARLAAWARLVEDGRWDALYAATMRIIAAYFVHTDEEERAQAELLWPAFTDAELAEVMQRFRAERGADAAARDAALMLPALNPAEREAIGVR
jgi:hypothetical protein